MKPTSAQAVNRMKQNENLSMNKQLLVDEMRFSKHFFIFVVGLLLVLWSLFFSDKSISQIMNMSVSQVDVRGQLRFVKQNDLQRILAKHVENGFLTVELREIKEKMEDLPWVFSVRLRRAWPDKIIVNVQEQKPVAVWTDKGLINEKGELFLPKDLKEIDTGFLPTIVGPQERMEQTWERFLILRETFDDYELGIRRMVLDEKGGQKIVLKNGIHVVLGSQDLEKRLTRFFGVYEKHLESQKRQIETIDLRYTNGVAVSWLPQKFNQIAARN